MADYKLNSAIVPVTGGASGIGLAICERLRSEGATPILLDVNPDALNESLRIIYPDKPDPSAFGHLLDVSKSADVEACLSQIEQDHGPITHAVASAGIVKKANILDISDDEWLRIIDINLNGMMYFCRGVGRRMARDGSGAIVTISSIGGIQAKQERAPYAASKAGVINLTRALALDLGGSGVRANSVAPGLVETPIQILNSPEFRQASAQKTALGRWGTAGEVADATLFLLSAQASYITGAVLVVDGGLTARYA